MDRKYIQILKPGLWLLNTYKFNNTNIMIQAKHILKTKTE